MRSRAAVPSPVRTLSHRAIAAAATAAVTAALLPASPAAALERRLPAEDRALLLSAVQVEDPAIAALRLYDLLPPADAEPADAEPADADTDADAAPAEVVHVLAAGETLADVAALHGIDGDDGWRRLYDANPEIEDPDLVEVGTSVRIPDPEEELEPRALPTPPRPAAGTSRGGAGAGVWDRLAACEANGNWAANTGNGYYGGLQFALRSWQAVGGTGLPHEHSRATQIAMGERLRAAQGWGAWPACSRKLGLR
jgi:hypothetical protein